MAAARVKHLWGRLNDAAHYPAAWAMVAAADFCLGVIIVKLVPYTEIDWVAYMQEVEGPMLHGQWDYMELKGDTGPLVYPAGFVWVFAALREITNGGTDIKRAQYLFAGLHALLLFFVLGAIYYEPSAQQTKSSLSRRDERGDDQTRKSVASTRASDDDKLETKTNIESVSGAPNTRTPLWVVIALVCSKRIHSIFALRLFNDGVAMLLMYACLFLLVRQRWTISCILFSFALSIKMNILLFAPGLAVILIQTCGLVKALLLGLLCVAIQVGLAIPFLAANPWGYIERAFELGRVFKFQWTVNWKFLPEPIFVSPELALGLLVATLLTWLAFGQRHFASQHPGGLIGLLQSCVVSPFQPWLDTSTSENPQALSNHILRTLLTSNFIGVAFARSMHYQFYSWYFHSLAFLCASTTMPLPLSLLALAAIEWSFNIFPATPLSSAALQVAHLCILSALWVAPRAVLPRSLPHTGQLKQD